MNWNRLIRQGHRWVSMAFTLTVAAIFIAIAFGQPPEWVYLTPLPLLALLLVSGVYLFALPYVRRKNHVELTR